MLSLSYNNNYIYSSYYNIYCEITPVCFTCFKSYNFTINAYNVHWYGAKIMFILYHYT